MDAKGERLGGWVMVAGTSAARSPTAKATGALAVTGVALSDRRAGPRGDAGGGGAR